MDFVSYFGTNELMTSADLEKKWGKKCSTGERFLQNPYFKNMPHQDKCLQSWYFWIYIFQNYKFSYERYKTGKISSNITNTNLNGLWLPKAETLRHLLTNKTILMPIAHFALLCFDILFQMKFTIMTLV